MDAVVPWMVTAVVLVAVLGGLAWLAARTRRRGVGQDVMGPVDMIYRPHTHEINREHQVQQERMVGMAAPDDAWRGGRSTR